MSRITTIENATITREVLAPSTEIQWNPLDPENPGQIVFRCAEYTSVDGRHVSIGPAPSLAVPLSEMIRRVYTVPTPAGPVDVPAMLVVGAIKAAFEQHYAEHMEAEETPIRP